MMDFKKLFVWIFFLFLISIAYSEEINTTEIIPIETEITPTNSDTTLASGVQVNDFEYVFLKLNNNAFSLDSLNSEEKTVLINNFKHNSKDVFPSFRDSFDSEIKSFFNENDNFKETFLLDITESLNKNDPETTKAINNNHELKQFWLENQNLKFDDSFLKQSSQEIEVLSETEIKIDSTIIDLSSFPKDSFNELSSTDNGNLQISAIEFESLSNYDAKVSYSNNKLIFDGCKISNILDSKKDSKFFNCDVMLDDTKLSSKNKNSILEYSSKKKLFTGKDIDVKNFDKTSLSYSFDFKESSVSFKGSYFYNEVYEMKYSSSNNILNLRNPLGNSDFYLPDNSNLDKLFFQGGFQIHLKNNFYHGKDIEVFPKENSYLFSSKDSTFKEFSNENNPVAEIKGEMTLFYDDTKVLSRELEKESKFKFYGTDSDYEIKTSQLPIFVLDSEMQSKDEKNYCVFDKKRLRGDKISFFLHENNEENNKRYEINTYVKNKNEQINVEIDSNTFQNNVVLNNYFSNLKKTSSRIKNNVISMAGKPHENLQFSFLRPDDSNENQINNKDKLTFINLNCEKNLIRLGQFRDSEELKLAGVDDIYKLSEFYSTLDR